MRTKYKTIKIYSNNTCSTWHLRKINPIKVNFTICSAICGWIIIGKSSQQPQRTKWTLKELEFIVSLSLHLTAYTFAVTYWASIYVERCCWKKSFRRMKWQFYNRNVWFLTVDINKEKCKIHFVIENRPDLSTTIRWAGDLLDFFHSHKNLFIIKTWSHMVQDSE